LGGDVVVSPGRKDKKWNQLIGCLFASSHI
jgi:hypothetical protein